METTSRFQSFVGKSVQSGSKPSSSMFPTLLVTSTKDKFQLDKKARAMMGVDVEGYVNFIDVNLGAVTTEDPNARWFITKGWKDQNNQPKGAKIGKGGTFSYAGVYTAMQINKSDITEGTDKDLVELSKGRIYETPSGKEAFVATNKVSFKVVKFVIRDSEGNVTQDQFEVAPDVIQDVFMLTERTEIPHDSSAGLDESEQD